MAKERFVNNNLLKIRDKLKVENADKEDLNKQAQASTSSVENRASSPNPRKEDKSKEFSAISNERDWKKAVFKRWDEFKAVRKDIINRLSERIACLPKEIEHTEGHAIELKQAKEKLQKVLDEVNALDDSGWNRHNFTSELAVAMRKLENARIEFMMQASKIAPANNKSAQLIESSSAPNSIIHELNSLSFKQCFRIGLGFFMPLIIAMILAVLVWGLIYYISLN